MNETFELGMKIISTFLGVFFGLPIIYYALIKGNEGECLFFGVFSVVVGSIFAVVAYGVGYAAEVILPYLRVAL